MEKEAKSDNQTALASNKSNSDTDQGKKPPWLVILVVLIGLVGGGLGYQQYQMQQEKLRQAEIQRQKLERQAAEAAAEAERQRQAELARQEAERIEQEHLAQLKAERQRQAERKEQERLAQLEAKRKAKAEEARKAEQERRAKVAREQQRILDLVGKLVLIPSGSFIMGKDGGLDDNPAHRVNISRFYMMEHEATFALWDACVADGQCERPEDEGWGRGSRPVINVSWRKIIKQFIPWLNQKTGKTFRLPSESEWEYAARGRPGRSDAKDNSGFSWGNSINCSKARYNGGKNSRCYWLNANASYRGTAEVKSYAPNNFGLYDMHGNVSEWVQDCLNNSYYGAPDNNKAWESGICRARMVRGGSWSTDAFMLQAAIRFKSLINVYGYSTGFRLVQDE